MPLNKNEARAIGLRVKRIEGEGEQEIDVGRIGTILSPNGYNVVSGSITVKYDSTDLLPEKTDDCCSFFEFEKVP
ncbi:MAG: hypothetical protein NUV47_00455 [Patescibacteria group bacterium]|nr:hypothetical protein [Patescibacteria group bacterium]